MLLLNKWRRYEILVFLLPLVVFVFSLNGLIADQGVSATIQGMQYSMWKNHSFDLGEKGNPIITSIDIGLYKGKYYSATSPGIGFLSLPFASVGFMLDGGDLNIFGYSIIMAELFLAICASFAALFVYKICRFYAQPIPSLLAAITFAFATSVWTFTTVLFIQDASVLFSTLSVYLLLRHVKQEENRRLIPVLSGLSLGLAVFVEYMTALFFPVLLAYLFFKRRNKLLILLFTLSFLAGPSMHFIYNYVAFENPFIFPEQLKVDGQSQDLWSRFEFNDLPLHALAYIISPYRGILLFSPVLILGMYQLYRMIKSNRHRADAVLFIGLFLVILLPYSAWHDWSGGLAYGPRFLISAIPYFVIPISILLSEKRSYILAGGFLSLFVVSSFIQGAGALAHPFSIYGDVLTYQPTEFNIPLMFEGDLTTWWFFKLGIFFSKGTASLFQLFATVVFILLWHIAAYFSIKSVGETKNSAHEAENGG
ncbi:MAG: ArnT family glycosyltransferase [Nitrososphaerales archaeon]